MELGQRGPVEAEVLSSIHVDVAAGVIAALRYHFAALRILDDGDNAWRCGACEYIGHCSVFWKAVVHEWRKESPNERWESRHVITYEQG